jgi:hypothetical protein
LLEVLTRALHLLLLAIAPSSASPEPLPPEPLAVYGLLSAAGLVALALLALAFRRAMTGYRGSTAAAALAWTTIAVALTGAAVCRGDRAPLAHAVPFVAPFAWATLAGVACAAADRWAGSTFKHKRMTAITIVLAIGTKIYVSAGAYLGSDERLWGTALRRDGRHERALRELARPLLERGRYDQAVVLAERCLKYHPDAPACLALRAEAEAARRNGNAP